MMRLDWRGAMAHGPSMRFIDEVIGADDRSLAARIARMPTDHPLVTDGRVGSVILVEYAAQAAAAHACLCGHVPRKAYLAAVRNIRLSCAALIKDLLPIELTVAMDISTDRAASYEFSAYGNDRELAQGRLTLAYFDKLEQAS